MDIFDKLNKPNAIDVSKVSEVSKKKQNLFKYPEISGNNYFNKY